MKTFNQFQEGVPSLAIKGGSKLIPAAATIIGGVGTYLQTRKDTKGENHYSKKDPLKNSKNRPMKLDDLEKTVSSKPTAKEMLDSVRKKQQEIQNVKPKEEYVDEGIVDAIKGLVSKRKPTEYSHMYHGADEKTAAKIERGGLKGRRGAEEGGEPIDKRKRSYITDDPQKAMEYAKTKTKYNNLSPSVVGVRVPTKNIQRAYRDGEYLAPVKGMKDYVKNVKPIETKKGQVMQDDYKYNVSEEGLRSWFGKSSGTTKSGRKVKGWVQVGG